MSRTDAILAVLAQAMQIEREGMAFYGQAAAKSENPRVREVFHSLVGDETTHLRILQAEFDAVKGSGQWLPAATALPQISGGLTLFPKSAAAETAASAQDLDALKMAMNMEQKGYDLYIKAAQETVDADGQALYRRLAKMESGHYKVLQDAYGYLTHPDHWYDEEEKPIFEG